MRSGCLGGFEIPKLTSKFKPLPTIPTHSDFISKQPSSTLTGLRWNCTIFQLLHPSEFFFKFLRKLYLFPLCNRFKNKRHLAMKCTGFMGGGEGRFLGMQCFIAVVVLDIFENTLCAQSTTSYTQMCALFTRTHRFKHTHTYMNIISLCAHTCSKTLSNLNKHDDHARRLTHAQVYTIVNMYTRTHAHTNTYIHTKKHKYTHTNECRMRLTAAACHKEDV